MQGCGHGCRAFKLFLLPVCACFCLFAVNVGSCMTTTWATRPLCEVLPLIGFSDDSRLIQPTRRNNLTHHLARQPDQCSQHRCHQKPGPVGVPKRALQFSNNPDPTNNFLSTPTTKSAVSVDTDHVSTGMQSRPPPALMSQSMTKEPAQHTKSPQILLGAMFA